MRINHNISSINTQNRMEQNMATVSKSLQKLSSGQRINAAGDDAAGLAISEKMRGQVRGLDQANRNAQDGISMIQTAEGAMNEIHNLLQRTRELAVQASNDTLTSADRSNLNDEVTQLKTEIDRIKDNTEFNTKKLLNGGMSKVMTAAQAQVMNNTNLATSVTSTSLATALTDSNGNTLNIVAGDKITVSYFTNTGGITTTDATVSSTTDVASVAALVTQMALSASTAGLKLTASSGGNDNAVFGLSIQVKDSNGVIKAPASAALSGFSITTKSKDLSTENSAVVHIGSNANQSLSVDIDALSTRDLGIAGANVSTQKAANSTITAVDNAIQTVSKERSKMGSLQNRLEYTISNLNTSSENMQAAESRIRDVDMAKEMSNFTKNNILSQAAQAMLAQANQQSQGVLQLLR